MNDGWIKIYRKLIEWEWYADSNTKAVFLHLLFLAHFKPSNYKGYDLKIGDIVYGRKSFSEMLGISEQSVRTAINHLKSTNEVTIKSTNKFSIITLVNYSKYQCEDEQANQPINQQANQQLTNNQPTTNQQLTTYEECNNVIKKECNKEIDMSPTFSDTSKQKKQFVLPKIEEIFTYCSERNNKVEPQRFFDFYQSKGWMIGKNKMKDWKAAVRTWEKGNNQALTKFQKPNYNDPKTYENERSDTIE